MNLYKPDKLSDNHIITEAEAGMKVLRFLERNLGLPRPLLFRWLRTGQVRVNKHRVKQDYILCLGDSLRLPPQANTLRVNDIVDTDAAGNKIINISKSDIDFCSGHNTNDIKNDYSFGQGLRIIHADKHILVLDKKSGLPVQPGSGHKDSVSSRLKNSVKCGDFFPAPAHRLDKDSSGIVVAGRTHQALTWLHKLFSNADGKNIYSSDYSGISRKYIVWVSGKWELDNNTLLEDMLGKYCDIDGLEKMVVYPSGGNGAKKAAGIYSPIKYLQNSPCGPATLLEVILITGRKHQIRVQCASRKHPVIGDRRYSGPPFKHLLLHACKLGLPDGELLGEKYSAAEYISYPCWPKPFSVEV